MTEEFQKYLSGESLFGDDFTMEEIQKWFSDEAEGYAELGSNNISIYNYNYHKLNELYAFKFFRNMRFAETLGVGSAYGDEFIPIAQKIERITILDPSDAFSNIKEIHGTPCKYIKPTAVGKMAFEDNKFDLITSLGVMHHIPNVSYIMSECYRCLKEGGIMLLREPIFSMGDWRKARKGLTKRERGIPLEKLNGIVQSLGFVIKYGSPCCFPLISKIGDRIGIKPYNNIFLTMADALLSKIFFRNIKYHRTKLHEKFAPTSIYYVLEK